METIVVGAGAVGLAIAWRAAQAGLSVTQIDPEPGRGASWAAAGMLAPVTEVHYGEDVLLELNLAAQRRWPSFARELLDASGVDPGYRECGTVVVARDADDSAALGELLAFQQSLGLDARRVSQRELRQLEPALSPRVRGGIEVPADHQVDNRRLVEALQAACAVAGVVARTDTVAEVSVAAGRVDGVSLVSGEMLAADAVVVAAGAASGSIGGVPAAAVPPVRPVKGQLLHLRDPVGRPLTTRTVRGLDVYVVSRPDGRVVVGATVEERGMDTTVTAGGALELLTAAWELLPGITELELVEAVAGLRPGTPDNAPLLGATAVDGLLLATGHYRNGILLTPVTADGIVALLRGDGAPSLDAFRADRFTAVAT